MNKKSFLLSLILAGLLLTPNQAKPTESILVDVFLAPIILVHYFSLGAITSLAGVGATTALTLGYLIKSRLQKYKKARNFLTAQSEIKTYKATITIKERPPTAKKFNNSTICYTFSNSDYKLLIEEVKKTLEVFKKTEIPKFKNNSKLHFIIETEVLLKEILSKNEQAYQLFPTNLDTKISLNRTFTDKDIKKITKKIEKKFYIPELNIGYKMKAFFGFLGGVAISSTVGLAVIICALINPF